MIFFTGDHIDHIAMCHKPGGALPYVDGYQVPVKNRPPL